MRIKDQKQILPRLQIRYLRLQIRKNTLFVSPDFLLLLYQANVMQKDRRIKKYNNMTHFYKYMFSQYQKNLKSEIKNAQ